MLDEYHKPRYDGNETMNDGYGCNYCHTWMNNNNMELINIRSV